MKKTKLIVSLAALSATIITPVITLASCKKEETTTVKAIPESMLNIENNVLMGLTESASVDSYDTLVIPESVVAINKEAFKDAFVEETNASSSIKTVVFNKNLQYIGTDAFNGCTSLTSLDFSNMQDIKLMALSLSGSTVFASCSNKSGRVKLPEGITDMQKECIKTQFTNAGLPASWFGETQAPDQETVDTINTIIKAGLVAGQEFNTMSSMINYVKETSLGLYDIEKLQPTNANEQYVWDSYNKKVVEIDQNGNLTCSPSDEEYTLPEKIYIWKMVKPSEPSKVLKSSTNFRNSNNAIYVDEFDTNSKYSQYLRSDYEFETSASNPLVFTSGLDTGTQYNLVLKFEEPEEAHAATPIVNTQKCELTINGDLGSVDHYGNLTTLTVTEECDGTTYNEYGSVDAAIVIASGSVNTQEGSQVNEIIINCETVEEAQEIKIRVADGSDIGTIGATEPEVAAVLKTGDDPIVKAESETTDVGEIRTGGTVAEPEGESGDFYSGEGTANAPYTIKTAAQLWNFATKVAARSSEDEALYFNLIADIDMSDEEAWTPVGTEAKPFRGIFNGCGFSIKNITYKAEAVEVPSELTDPEEIKEYKQKHNHVGFFGNVEGALNGDFRSDISAIWKYDSTEGEQFQDGHLDETNIAESKYTTVIKNLTIDNVRAVGTDSEDVNKYFVGGIAGIAQYAYFNNCKVTSGTISGYKHVGGMVGASGCCIFKDCAAGQEDADALNITADIYHVGGMVGSVAYCNASFVRDVTNSAVIGCETGSNCTIKVNGPDEEGGCVGGMTGDNQATMASLYDSCTNNANIEVASRTAGIYLYGVAGICCRGSNVQVVNNCVNNGDITVPTADGHYAGWVAGIIAEETAHYVLKCYNSGKITGNALSLAGIAAGCTAGTYIDPDCANFGEYYIHNTLSGGKENLIHDKPSSI